MTDSQPPWWRPFKRRAYRGRAHRRRAWRKAGWVVDGGRIRWPRPDPTGEARIVGVLEAIGYGALDPDHALNQKER